MDNSNVSIIVIAYNEEKMLSLCLDSLMELDYPEDKLEIILVDNNSTDRTKDIIRKYPVRYVFEHKRTCGAARNKGIKASSGEFIAFTDADCIVNRSWIRRLVQGFDSDNIGGCGGKILTYQPKNWVENIDCNKLFNQQRCIAGENIWLPFILTPNAIYRKDILEEVGCFDDNFTTSDDVDLAWRVLLKGYQIRYVPGSIVWHKCHYTLVSLCRKFFIYGISHAQLFRKYHSIFKTSSLFARISMEDPSFPTILIKSSHLLGMLYGLLKLRLEKRQISKVMLDKQIIWWWQDENVVILDLNNNSYYHLEGSGARIWELLNEPKKIEEIVDILGEEYGVEKSQIRRNIIDLSNELKGKGLFSDRN